MSIGIVYLMNQRAKIYFFLMIIYLFWVRQTNWSVGNEFPGLVCVCGEFARVAARVNLSVQPLIMSILCVTAEQLMLWY